jgi:hypothetical protein
MSLHRACCCGCPASLEIVIAGVDAAKCTCAERTGSPGNSWKIDLLSVDGTYSVDFAGERTASGHEVCDYFSCFEFDDPIMRQLAYTGLGCTGTPTSTAERSKLTVNMTIYKETRKVAAVSIFARLNCADGFGFRIFQNLSNAYPGIDYPVSNTIACNFNDSASNGGTVSLA